MPIFFFPVFMIFFVKIYMKRHDRHKKTLCTFFNRLLVFCLVSCSSINQVSYFILNKVVTDPNLTCLLLRKKKNGKKKMYLGQVFQSVTALRHRFFSFGLIPVWMFKGISIRPGKTRLGVPSIAGRLLKVIETCVYDLSLQTHTPLHYILGLSSQPLTPAKRWQNFEIWSRGTSCSNRCLWSLSNSTRFKKNS